MLVHQRVSPRIFQCLAQISSRREPGFFCLFPTNIKLWAPHMMCPTSPDHGTNIRRRWDPKSWMDPIHFIGLLFGENINFDQEKGYMQSLICIYIYPMTSTATQSGLFFSSPNINHPIHRCLTPDFSIYDYFSGILQLSILTWRFFLPFSKIPGETELEADKNHRRILRGFEVSLTASMAWRALSWLNQEPKEQQEIYHLVI